MVCCLVRTYNMRKTKQLLLKVNPETHRQLKIEAAKRQLPMVRLIIASLKSAGVLPAQPA